MWNENHVRRYEEEDEMCDFLMTTFNFCSFE